MQHLHNDPAHEASTLNIGWKAMVFGVLTVAVSLLLSVVLVDVITPFLR